MVTSLTMLPTLRVWARDTPSFAGGMHMDRREHAPEGSRRWGPEPRIVGRYAVFDAIATGGMATVHFGRLMGPAGFSRTVVVKRLHAQYAGDAELATMFLDEARVAARIRHPNVVPVIDVVADGGEILLVMEYVHGESLAHLVARGRAGLRRRREEPRRLQIPATSWRARSRACTPRTRPPGRTGGRSAWSTATSRRRTSWWAPTATRACSTSASPRPPGQAHHTGAGQVKGKIRYLSPEQVTCGEVDRRADLWAAGVVLWEALTGKKLFSGDCDAGCWRRCSTGPSPPLATSRPTCPRTSRGWSSAPSSATVPGASPPRRRWPPRSKRRSAWSPRARWAPGSSGSPALASTARRQVLDEIEAETVILPEVTSPVDDGGSAPKPRATPAARAAAQTFAVTTDAAMVRESTAAEQPAASSFRRRRVPALAWGSSAAVVLAIAAGVGARNLARSHALSASASPVLPEAVAAAATVILAAPPELAPPPPPPSQTAPASSSSALPVKGAPFSLPFNAPRRGHGAVQLR